MDAEGNIFWGYSISGSNENGGHILPTLAAVHNFPDNMEANAHLIAAAPDLLEALKRAQRVLSMAQPSGPSDFMTQIDAAIDRAEGRTPDTGE